MVRLHCEMHRNNRGKFQAVCLETSVAVVGDTPEQTKKKLDRAIGTYLESVAEDVIRLADEGKLDLRNAVQVQRELSRHFQPVRYYRLRLLKWHLSQSIARGLISFLSGLNQQEGFVEERTMPFPAHG